MRLATEEPESKLLVQRGRCLCSTSRKSATFLPLLCVLLLALACSEPSESDPELDGEPSDADVLDADTVEDGDLPEGLDLPEELDLPEDVALPDELQPDDAELLEEDTEDQTDEAEDHPDEDELDVGPELSKEEVFVALGISSEPLPRTDPNGNLARDDYNPLGYAIAPIGTPTREIYLGASSFNALSSTKQVLVDALPFGAELVVEPTTLLLQEANDALNDNPKKSVAADVDGDGIDEIVVATYLRACCSPTGSANKIAVRLIDPKTTLSTQVGLIPTSVDFAANFAGRAQLEFDWDEHARSWDWACAFFRTDLAAGDLDGDNRAEIIVLVANELFVLDDREANFAQLAHKTMPTVGGGGAYVRIDTADFDQDGRDELIVTNGCDAANCLAQVSIFDGPELTTTLLDAMPLDMPRSGLNNIGMVAADVATGDFDGDGLPDAAFAGHEDTGSAGRNTLVFVLRTTMDENSKPQFALLESWAGIGFPSTEDGGKPRFVMQGIAAGDFDGERGDELVTFDNIYKLQDNLGRLELTRPFGENRLRLPTMYNLSIDYPRGDSMAMGDVNADGKEDVVYLSHDGDQLFVISYVQGTDLKYSFAYLASDFYTTLSLPNADRDSLIVEYMGSQLLFTDPIILTVLASPPYWAGINDDGEGETSLGEISSSGSGIENSMGIHASASVGVVVGASAYGLVRIEAEVKASIEKSFTWAMAVDWDQTESFGYVTGQGEDRVVFTAMPYDIYTYKVLSSPDGLGLGDPIILTVPREPTRYNTTVDFYNAHNGAYEDVGPEVLPHTPGNPYSYYSSVDRDVLKARVGERSLSGDYTLGDEKKGLFPSTTHEVGEGTTGVTTIDIEKTCTTSHSFSYATDVSLEAQLTIAWFTTGGSAGIETEHSYNMSSAEGIYLGGSVASIPAEFYDPQHRFSWGLMSYPYETAGGQTYTVLNYFVDHL